MYNIESIQLVAAFGYCEANFADMRYKPDDSHHMVRGDSMPWCFLEGLYEHLWKLAGWERGDNKVTFVFTDGLSTFYALQFYDCKASLISWGFAWATAPDNFGSESGHKRVTEACETYKRLLRERKGWRCNPEWANPPREGFPSCVSLEGCSFKVGA